MVQSLDRRPPVNTSADGRFAFDGLSPDEDVFVTFRHRTGPSRSSRSRAARPRTLDVVLAPGTTVTLRLVDEDGGPVPYASAILSGSRTISAPRTSWSWYGPWTWARFYRSVRDGTDVRGELRLSSLYTGSFRVRFEERSRNAPIAFASFEVTGEERELEVEVTVGGRVRVHRHRRRSRDLGRDRPPARRLPGHPRPLLEPRRRAPVRDFLEPHPRGRGREGEGDRARAPSSSPASSPAGGASRSRPRGSRRGARSRCCSAPVGTGSTPRSSGADEKSAP